MAPRSASTRCPSPCGRFGPRTPAWERRHAHPHTHDDEHAHAQPVGAHRRRHHPDAAAGAAAGALGAVHAAGTSPERIVAVERDILAKNDAFARENRRLFADRGLFASISCRAPDRARRRCWCARSTRCTAWSPIAVIEGDQQTSRDADRIRATGAPAVQINTGKGCHLDAQMVGQRARHAAADAGRHPVHRERRQPRLSGRVRPRRGAQGRHPVRHRRRGQAAQVSRHVPRRRSRC